MISSRNFAIPVLGVMLSMSLIYAQDLSSYRQFQFGMDLNAVAEKADVKLSQARLIHQRPAMIQELEWRPRNSLGPSLQTDSVIGAIFGFYNGQLYRIVVDYDPYKTEGLTEEDLVEGISAQYGTPTVPVAKIISSSSSQTFSDSEKVIARWEDPQYSVNLFRFSYKPSFGLLIFSKRLDAMAQVAIVEAVRLDRQEAPQREIDRQNKQDEEKRAVEQKARPANKVGFRP
jgi:hypothetical protein